MCKKKCNFAAKLIEMMKKKFFQILIWLGILFGCTIVAVAVGMLLFRGNIGSEPGGKTPVYVEKWLQFIQVVGMFVAPPIICATIWDEHHQPQQWLKIDRGTDWTHFLMAVGIMIVAIPAINLFAYLNSLIPMPESWIAKDKGTSEKIMEWLQVDEVGMILNFGLFALLPAFAEELTFRGTLQQIMAKSEEQKAKVHIAIWVTAILFSAIHMQFLGFIPRMLMGALFGYMFVWTGTLWIPILMHFTNNAFGIGLYYILPQNSNADTFGAGTTWYIGLISLVLTSLGLLIFYRRTHIR